MSQLFTHIYKHIDHTKNHLYVILQLENDEQMYYATCTNLYIKPYLFIS